MLLEGGYIMTISWVCDWCGNLLKVGEEFFLVHNRKIGKKGEIIELDGNFFYCKKCIRNISG